MEHEVRAQAAGLVREVPAAVGVTVPAGAVLVVLAESGADAAGQAQAEDVPLDHVRPDLAEVRERHRIGLDEGRPEVTERRHAAGRRTARENIADLADPGSFTEYGALTIAAQRRRRPLDDLIARTPADGLVLGTATVDGRPVAVMSYDYTVLAGTQGHMNHRKTDRLLELVRPGAAAPGHVRRGRRRAARRHRHHLGGRAGRADVPADRRAVGPGPAGRRGVRLLLRRQRGAGRRLPT